MKNRVITISREFGSGGRTIGKKVAEKLEILCYDAKIIQEMVKQEGLDVEIVPMPIYRADTGLAFSSRNARLSDQQTSDAPQIYSILSKAVALKNAGKDVAEVKEFVENEFAKSPFELEYFEITDENSLLSIQHFSEAEKVRGFVVAYAGDVRLIDNIEF